LRLLVKLKLAFRFDVRRNAIYSSLGNVYNITPYLDYHPGGVDEIMKGAGIDATVIFQEIHAWVS
jgi:cytochrome b involved in lipid metabolism